MMRSKESAELGPLERMLAACVGSIATSALLTPLDALRIRLQVARTINHAPLDCPILFRISDGLCGFMDAEGPEALRHCDCRMASRLLNSRSAVQALQILVREEGWRSLYSALPITVVVAVPSVVLYYAGYDEVRARLLRVLPDVPATVLSAASSRLLSTTLISPLEMVRTQTQARAAERRPWYRVMAAIAQERGPRALWRGLPATLWRDVPFSMVYWLIYERGMARCRRRPGTTGLGASFLSGAVAGAVASVVTHPFDVAKTRIQTQWLRGSSTTAVPGTTWALLAAVYRTEGMRGLFVGWQPRLVRVVPACAIMITTYEAMKWALQAVALPP